MPRWHFAIAAAAARSSRSGLFSNISWVTMLSTLLVGGTLVLLRTFSPREALAIIEAERITHGAFVPVQLERLLCLPGARRVSHDSLETLMVCGSPLKPDVKLRFAREFACRLIELYGLTEGLMTILEPEDLERKILSVGKPVLGADIRILGEDDREVAPGETGEIVGRGRLVMSGYHAQDAANREATWVDSDGVQWLRTGDLGRLDAEGFLYLVDRKKDMIISGGQNVYPADIESVMRDHPAVAEVAVIGIASERWGETPLAVVVARPGRRCPPPSSRNGPMCASASSSESAVWCGARVCRETPTARCSSANFEANIIRVPPTWKNPLNMNAKHTQRLFLRQRRWTASVLPYLRRAAARRLAGAVSAGSDAQQPRFRRARLAPLLRARGAGCGPPWPRPFGLGSGSDSLSAPNLR